MKTDLTDMERITNKKKVVLTLCKLFPVTHAQAGKPTDFERKVKSGTKIHTIRWGYDLWVKRYSDINAGTKYLSVKEWVGRPYHSEHREYAQIEKIGLQRIKLIKTDADAIPQVFIDGKRLSAHEVALNDGLSVEDFTNWFFGSEKIEVFDGAVIHFTGFRY